MATCAAATARGRIAGSFRDPAGYVFEREGRILRAVRGECAATLDGLTRAGLLDDLMGEGMLVGTRRVDAEHAAELEREHPGYCDFFEHERVAPITYPYEWCASMLADAAVLTLELELRLVEAGHALKDATAYNVQFAAGRPVFLDAASIERPERLDVWHALGQFNRMFTFPLLLCRHRGWDLRSYFLAARDGQSVEQMARACGPVGRWRPAMMLDVGLPWMLGRAAERRQVNAAPVPTGKVGDPAAQRLNLLRLRRKVKRLAAGYRPRGVWADYARTCSYATETETAKKRIVCEMLAAAAPRTVLDLGANTGEYSELAAAAGAEVVAVDADHDAVEVFYRRLRGHRTRITPIVADITCPSPGFGYRNEERAPLVERIGADCVLALALVHHLTVAGNLGLDAVCELFHDLAGRDLVVEFVPPEDAMFRRLAAGRHGTFEHLTREAFRAAFERRFVLVREAELPGCGRVLFHFRRGR